MLTLNILILSVYLMLSLFPAVSYDQYRISVILLGKMRQRMAILSAQRWMNTVQNLVEVATSDLNEQWAIFSQGALRVSARELEERVNTVKSDLDKMSAHIDLKTPKLRPWDDAQLGKLQDLLNEIENRGYMTFNILTDSNRI